MSPTSTPDKGIAWFGKNHSAAQITDTLGTTSVGGLSDRHYVWLLLKDRSVSKALSLTPDC